MATIREIAERAGVSVTTVSRVLNMDETLSVADDTRVKIFGIAEELEYVPRKNRKGKEEETSEQETLPAKEIAIVYWYDYEQEMEDPYYLSIRLAIEEKAKEYGYRYHTVNAGSLENLTSAEVGVLVLGRLGEDVIESLKEQYEHVIIIDNDFDSGDCDHVGSDFGKATKEALEYLYGLGHRKIAHLGGRIYDEETNWENFHDDRDVAYEEFMKKNGIYDEKMVFDVGSFSLRNAYHKVADEIARGNIPTAIMSSNDSMAIGAYRAISEAGLRIPEDVSVISFNDQPNAKYMLPPLSTVKIPTKYIGYTAVDLLAERERSPREYYKVVMLHPKLKIRRSCGPVKADR